MTTPTKLSPEEIIALLPRLAVTNRAAALLLIDSDTPGSVEYPGRYTSLLEAIDCAGSSACKGTVLLPPLRRALRREELPEGEFFIWTNDGSGPSKAWVDVRDGLPVVMTAFREWTIEMLAFESNYIWGRGSPHAEDWHLFRTEEPQPDLVVGGEGS